MSCILRSGRGLMQENEKLTCKHRILRLGRFELTFGKMIPCGPVTKPIVVDVDIMSILIKQWAWLNANIKKNNL